jgi:hypothetical protein
MKTRCTAHLVNTIHKEQKSWRKAAQILNSQFNVNLSHTTWRDYGIGRHDIADPHVRERLGLPPRPCPTCGKLPGIKKYKAVKRIRIPSYGYPSEPLLALKEMFEHRYPSK